MAELKSRLHATSAAAPLRQKSARGHGPCQLRLAAPLREDPFSTKNCRKA